MNSNDWIKKTHKNCSNAIALTYTYCSEAQNCLHSIFSSRGQCEQCEELQHETTSIFSVAYDENFCLNGHRG